MNDENTILNRSSNESDSQINSNLTQDNIEEYDPILSLISKNLKVSGQEIIVRDRKWHNSYNCFIVHREEDVIAASLKLLDLGAIENWDLILERCCQEKNSIWYDYYMVSIKKTHNHLEKEFSKLDFIKQLDKTN